MYHTNNIRVCVLLETQQNAKLLKQYEESKENVDYQYAISKKSKPEPFVKLTEEITLHGTNRLSVAKPNPKNPVGEKINDDMTFDFVGISLKGTQRREMALLFSDAFIKSRNCCLVRFINSTDCRFGEFYEGMVDEINNQIYRSTMKLKDIKVNYRDIPKDGMYQKCKNDIVNSANCKENSRGSLITAKDEFDGTADLKKWLGSNYRIMKTTDAAGLTSLEIQFTLTTYRDAQRPYRIRFHIYNVFLDRLGDSSRASYFSYLKQWRYTSRPGDFIHSALTKSLSNHLEGGSKKGILMLFEVWPERPNFIEYLRMADMMARTRTSCNIFRIPSIPNYNRKRPCSSKDVDNSNSKKSCDLPNVTDYKVVRRAVSFTVPLEKQPQTVTNPAGPQPVLSEITNQLTPPQTPPNQTQSPPVHVDRNYSQCDDDNLRVWYERIENAYYEAREHVQNYLVTTFAKKCTEWTECIHNVSQFTLDSHTDPTTLSVHSEGNSPDPELEMLHVTFGKFKELQNQIGSDFSYKQAVLIYFQKKMSDLERNLVVFKEKELHKLSKELQDFIADTLAITK